MVQVLSKMLTVKIADSCADLCHPWSTNCLREFFQAWCYSYYQCFKLYMYIYTLNLMLKCRVPTKQELTRTLKGIVISAQFFTTILTALNYGICIIGKFVNGFNIITGVILPTLMGSVGSIFQERQSRRPLLALYTSQESTTIIWNLLVSRGLVKSLPYGTTILFTVCTTIILFYVKAGLHVDENTEAKPKVDFLIKLLRYIVGQHEEKDYLQKHIDEITSNIGYHNNNSNGSIAERSSNKRPYLMKQVLTVFHKLIDKIKCRGRHDVCPHSFSCSHYVLKGLTKSFMTGVGIQTVMILASNISKIIGNPKQIMKLFFNRKSFSIPLTLMGFTGIFRTVCCSLRWLTGKDSMYHALVAGLLAGLAYSQYNSNSLAIYILWKTLAILYQRGIDAGYLPRVLYGHEIQYTLSSLVIFYALCIEPNSVRSGYWKSFHDLSGGRVAAINRSKLAAAGFDSAKQLETIMRRTRTHHGIKTLFG